MQTVPIFKLGRYSVVKLKCNTRPDQWCFYYNNQLLITHSDRAKVIARFKMSIVDAEEMRA